MSVDQNLWVALAEETKNRQMYLAFAEKADAEGQPQVARLFRAAAESELVHARIELAMLGHVQSTPENLKWAAAMEEREFQDLYARFLQEALNEGRQEAAKLIGYVMKVERGHHKQFLDMLAALQKGRQIPDRPVMVCSTCGNTVFGRQDQPCAVCGASAEGFVEIP
jgi:rubrerythrin